MRLDLLASFNQDGDIHADIGETGGKSYTLNIHSPKEPLEVKFNDNPIGFSYDSSMKIVDLNLIGDGKLSINIP
jgi:hypothetical protein